jgi:hypothetical protein
MNWLNDINNLKLPPLKRGAHKSPDEGLCAMEMVAFIERLPHSDAPECTCPVIASFVRTINDNFNNEYRQKLLTRLPYLVGTVSNEHAQQRAEFLAWKAIHVFAPIALSSAGLEKHAFKLENFKGTLAAATAAATSAAADAAADAARAAAAAATSAAADAATAAATSATSAAADAATDADIDADIAAQYAACAAHHASHFTNDNDLILQTLDELLEIGPKGNFTQYSVERVKELEAFA